MAEGPERGRALVGAVCWKVADVRIRPLGMLAAAVALLAAACGGGGSGGGGAADLAPPAEASGNIVLSGWGSSPAETALLKQVIADFQQKYPKVTVNFQPVSGDYPTAMLAKFSARKPPDVFYLDPNYAQDWIKQQLLEPLDDYIAKTNFDTSKFFPQLVDEFTGQKDGKTYGLPKDWSPLAMFVNPAYLTRAGVSTPKTWDDLAAAARKIQVPGGKPICLSADWARALAFVYQNGGSYFNDDKSQVTLDSAATKEALNWYVGMVRDGLAATPDKLGSGWCGEALGTGKAAIVFEGNWLVPAMTDQYPDVKYEIQPLVTGKQPANLAFTNAYAMAADSKNKSAAWALIQYLNGPDGMKVWTSKGLALPSRTDVAPLPSLAVFTQQAAAARPWQFPAGFSNVLTVMGNEITNAVQGKESVDELVRKVADAATQALSKSR
jgi:multiple sugar transport system substrate-binding protein